MVMADRKLPEGVKKVSLDSKLTPEKRQQIVSNFFKRVPSAEKRRRIVRLSGVMSEGQEYSDEFFAAMHYYSLEENATRMERDFQKFAAGGSSGLEGLFNISAPEGARRPEAEERKPQRTRRGKGT